MLAFLCAHRVDYRKWRQGQMHGSVGEIADITSVTGPKGSQQLHGGQQSEQLRALNLELSSGRRAAGRMPQKDNDGAKTTMSLYC